MSSPSFLRERAFLAALVLSVFQQQPVLPQSSTVAADNNGADRQSTQTTADWHQSMVGKPVCMTAKLPDGTTKSYMWYATRANNSNTGDTNLGLAIADDGINYEPISAEKSPYAVAGQVLSARQIVGKPDGYSSVRLGEPTITSAENGLRATFYHVELVADRAVSAGIASATSKDGVHWSLEKRNPMSISLTGRTSAEALELRLSRLSSACSQM